MMIPEDGSGLSDANSYVNLEFASSYFADRALDHIRVAEDKASGKESSGRFWVGTDEDREGALIRATDHIEGVFGWRINGPKKNPAQALSFPRDVDMDVPLNVMKACCEYALHALYTDLIEVETNTTTSTTKGKIIRLKEKIGPIETETQYSPDGAVTSVQTFVSSPQAYPLADMLMRPFLVASDIHPGGATGTGRAFWSSFVRN